MDLGIKYIALYDDFTISGIDLDQSKALPKDRWIYLRELCTKI